MHLGVEDGARVGGQLLPVRERGIPLRTGRCVWTVAQELEGRRIRSHHAGAGAGFDTHVADRHPAFHGQRFDGAAPIFDDVPLSAAGTDLGDHARMMSLAVTPGANSPSTLTAMVLNGRSGNV